MKTNTKIDWEKLRKEEWPILDKVTFLDAACVGFAPRRAVKAVKAFADMSASLDEENSSIHHIAMDNLRDKAYVEACKLLNADEEEIALVESTTHGLNIAATSLPLHDGDNIITTNLEFIQVALPWCAMRKTKDIEIRVCKTADSRFNVEDFAALCDDKTRMIVISTVEWCNGWSMDMKALGNFCKEHNIWLVVDAVQQLGVTKMDTKEFHVDILTAGGHKWLNSPYGTGILYINKELLPKIEPAFWGYLNTVAPECGWAAYWADPSAPSVNDWKFVPTARRFELGGTSNYCGAIALGESLALINEIGIENIEDRVMEISGYCMDRLEEIGATLITHRDAGHRSGTVVARLYADLEIDRKIYRMITDRHISISQRFTDYVGGYRFSCHYYNNKQDIDTVIDAFKECIKEIGREPDYKYLNK